MNARRGSAKLNRWNTAMCYVPARYRAKFMLLVEASGQSKSKFLQSIVVDWINQHERNTMNQTLPNSDSKTAIKVDGNDFDYPSSRGKGYDQIDYPHRNPSIAGKPGAIVTHTIKMRDLPGAIVSQLSQAHRDGNLREELARHLTSLEASKSVDAGTLKLLRGYQDDLLGLYGPDAETLDQITGIIQSLRPEAREP